MVGQLQRCFKNPKRSRVPNFSRILLAWNESKIHFSVQVRVCDISVTLISVTQPEWPLSFMLWSWSMPCEFKRRKRKLAPFKITFYPLILIHLYDERTFVLTFFDISDARFAGGWLRLNPRRSKKPPNPTQPFFFIPFNLYLTLKPHVPFHPQTGKRFWVAGDAVGRLGFKVSSRHSSRQRSNSCRCSPFRADWWLKTRAFFSKKEKRGARIDPIVVLPTSALFTRVARDKERLGQKMENSKRKWRSFNCTMAKKKLINEK